LPQADPNRAVGAGVEGGTGVGDIQSGGSPVRSLLSQALTVTGPGANSALSARVPQAV
jgi:hypothetical protein